MYPAGRFDGALRPQSGPINGGFFQCVAVRRGLAFPFLLAWSAAAKKCGPSSEKKRKSPVFKGFAPGGRGVRAPCGGRSFALGRSLLGGPLSFGGSGVVPVASLPLGPQSCPGPPPALRYAVGLTGQEDRLNRGGWVGGGAGGADSIHPARMMNTPCGAVGGRCRLWGFSQCLAHPCRWGPPPKRHRPPRRCQRH